MLLSVGWLIAKRSKKAWYFGGLWLAFAACFLYSMSAPGNGVRAGVIAYSSSPVKAVLQALYYGVAQMGTYLRLILLGLTVILIPFFYRAAKGSFL